MQLAMTILDRSGSRIGSIDFVDSPYPGVHLNDEGELCSMAPKDGTTTCHRHYTAYPVSNGKPVTLAITYVRNDEKQADAVERVLDRVEAYPFEIEYCWLIPASTTSASSVAHERSPRQSCRSPKATGSRRSLRRTNRS
jgi:hypothetical protein